MTETEFQALFESYDKARRIGAENPIPQKLHLLVYNYARIRYQQTSDVAADFYLHTIGKLPGILERYQPERAPFHNYIARTLHFEFQHFLRRRKTPRSDHISLQDLAERRVELHHKTGPEKEGENLPLIWKKLPNSLAIHAKLAFGFPLTFKELRLLLQRHKKNPQAQWQQLRSYRDYLRYTETKRRNFLRRRDRLLLAMERLGAEAAAATGKRKLALKQKLTKARKKFFSIDTRIPLRIVAAVSGDSIATVQRRQKEAIAWLKEAYAALGQQ